MKDIMKLINGRDYEISIGWLNKETRGQIDYEKHQICINLYLMVAETLIHEFMHDKYPELDEEEIIKKTTNKIKKLKVSEIIKITDTIMAYNLWQEEEWGG